MTIPSSPSTTADDLFAQIRTLAQQARDADRTIRNQVDAARATTLDGVTPISARAAYVSSTNLMKHGWSIKTYLPDVQIDGLLDAMKAGRRADVRDLVNWLDEDAAGKTKPGKTLPLDLHPDIARAVATPVRAWLQLQTALTPEKDIADALIDDRPSPSRRRLGR